MLGDFLPTVIRYIGIAVSLGFIMLGLYKLLCRLGMRREWAIGYSLISPWLIGFLIFTLFPILSSLYLSFTDYNILQPPHWRGSQNYTDLFTRDIDFWPAIRITLLYAFFSVPLGIIGSLLIALLLNNDIRGTGVYRTIYYLPTVLPEVAIALIWRWIFNPDAGLLNSILRPLYRLLNIAPPSWFSDSPTVLPAYIIISLWGITGVNMVIFLAALKNVPVHLYDSAQIDGAGLRQRFFFITVPMITPVIFLQLVRGVIAALQIFTVYAFTRPNPSAGKFVNYLIYQAGFQQNRMGYASALSWILFLIILGLTLLIFRSSETWVYYEGEKK